MYTDQQVTHTHNVREQHPRQKEVNLWLGKKEGSSDHTFPATYCSKPYTSKRNRSHTKTQHTTRTTQQGCVGLGLTRRAGWRNGWGRRKGPLIEPCRLRTVPSLSNDVKRSAIINRAPNAPSSSEPPGSPTTPRCCIAHSTPCPRPFLLFQ